MNSKLAIKIEDVIRSIELETNELSHPRLNEVFEKKFTKLGWEWQPTVFEKAEEPSAKIDFLKEREELKLLFHIHLS